MESMKDRTVIVPLEPDDIMKSVEALPRTLDEGAVVQVDFKRMKGNHLTENGEREKGQYLKRSRGTKMLNATLLFDFYLIIFLITLNGAG